MFFILALLFQYTKLYDQTNIFVGNLQLSAFFLRFQLTNDDLEHKIEDIISRSKINM